MLSDVLKRAVALVMQEHGAFALIRTWRAIRLTLAGQRAVLVSRDRPLHVMGDEEIEFAVIVVINPCRADTESGAGDTGLRGYIYKLSVVQVVKQVAVSDGADVDVVIAIVVIIPDCAAQS